MLEVVRFNFPYREKGSNRPDAMPILQETIRQEAGKARGTVLLGGRSMGGRAASMLAAEGFPCAALLLFAYPLHPAGQVEKLRAAHLPRIRVPVLCFNGTRDMLCDRILMERATGTLPNWTQHWLDGAKHSFGGEVMDEVARATAAWLRTCTDIQ
jgi:predicted alpha/beta-hydrolase family hydrolase